MNEMKKSFSKVLIIAALVICMSVAMPGLDAFAVTVGDLTVGVDVGRITLFQSETLSSCEFKSGSGTIPPGLELTYTKNGGVYLQNTPSTAGTYSFTCTVTTAEGTQDVDVSVYVVNAAADEPSYEGDKYLPVSTPAPTAAVTNTVPKITKHPTGETVEVGDTAKFIARADNSTKHTWRLVSADTTCTYKATEAEYYFPGLSVCAKTGTAEVGGEQKPNAMFTGFVDDEKYPLAFIVCVEDGGYGSTTCIPIASKVLEACKAVIDEG